MTWNLQRGQAVAGRIGAADMSGFAARIAANRADVVGLQEVTHEQAEALAGLLGWASPHYVETKIPCPGFQPPLPAACTPFGNAILSRHPRSDDDHTLLPASGPEAPLEARVVLRSVVEVPGSGLPGSGLPASRLPGSRLSVYVTHLASNASAAERQAQVATILALVDDDSRAPSGPFRPVLLGDFNADPTADAVAMVTNRFVDAWVAGRAVGPGFTSSSTSTLNRRIDYVFVGRTSGLRAIEVSVDPKVISDHLSVVAELA